MNDQLTIFKAPQGLGKITSHCLRTHLEQSDTLILEKRKLYTLFYIRKKKHQVQKQEHSFYQRTRDSKIERVKAISSEYFWENEGITNALHCLVARKAISSQSPGRLSVLCY